MRGTGGYKLLGGDVAVDGGGGFFEQINAIHNGMSPFVCFWQGAALRPETWFRLFL